jgi:predicted NBD/HSP70 family sugar kinase
MKKNKSDIPSLNSSRKILQLIQQNSLISRADIAECLGITRAGVTAAVNIMLKKNIIEEAGEVPNNSSSVRKGRRKVLLRINENYRFVAGAVIEENFISMGISNLHGDVIDKKYMLTDEHTDFNSVIQFIKNSYLDMIKENCISDKMILGAGIGISPPMRNRMNVSANGNEPDFSYIRDCISEKISCPVICGCSVAMTAAANMDFRSDTESRTGNEVFLQCGKIYSIIMISNNRLIEEFVPYSNIVEKCIVNTSPSVGNGCVKSEITSSAVINTICRIYSEKNTPYLYKITSGQKSNINMRKIQSSARNNDEKIKKIYNRYLEMLGILINNLICANYANRIVLHNNDIDEISLDYIKKYISEKYGKFISDRIVLSGIGKDELFLGGCAYAVRKLFYGI